MSWSIEDLLHRRTDLSTFVVHFTRTSGGYSSKDNLLSILGQSKIEARTAFGMGRHEAPDDKAFQESQRAVCFTETPIEHAWMMCAEIEGRANRFGPHGLAFTKVWARSNHANRVWYLDISVRGGASWLTEPIAMLRQEAVDAADRSGKSLTEYPITRLLPFIEQMGPTNYFRKEFWWEREWRHVGALAFRWLNVVAVFAPYQEHGEIRDAMAEMGRAELPTPPLLDPSWGLERMISALRGVPTEEAGPLPASLRVVRRNAS